MLFCVNFAILHHLEILLKFMVVFEFFFIFLNLELSPKHNMFEHL